jgi:hypothetical protein
MKDLHGSSLLQPRVGDTLTHGNAGSRRLFLAWSNEAYLDLISSSSHRIFNSAINPVGLAPMVNR